LQNRSFVLLFKHMRTLRTALKTFIMGALLLSPSLAGAAEGMPAGLAAKNTAVLLSEDCTKSTDGKTVCDWKYSNGSMTRHESFTTPKGEISILRKLDSAGKERARTEIHRKRTLVEGAGDSEMVEIFMYKNDVLMAREEAHYRYEVKSESPAEMEWTQYEVDPVFGDVTVTYHARLAYDQEGKPSSGRAGKWRKGTKTADFMNWDLRRDGLKNFQAGEWHRWESWVRNISLHAVFS